MIKRMKKNEKPKVLVLLSGGVDSAVAAGLLKKQGYQVIGAFLKFWKDPLGEKENTCCSLGAQNDARLIAVKLTIPLYFFCFAKEFKKYVVDYFIRSYQKGETPNPCIECNRFIKFGLTFKKLTQLKADYLATGHYARIEKEGKIFKLLRAKDRTKDQSYFLWPLTQEKLRKIIFPLGEYSKKEVRKLAKEWKLPVFEKDESQEVCFIGHSLKDFLSRYCQTKPGPIFNLKGEKIGEHQGLIYYTLGQRKGLKIPGGPFYVVKKDFRRNALIVANSLNDPLLHPQKIYFKKINWLTGKAPSLPFACEAKIRSYMEAQPAYLKKDSQGYFLEFESPPFAPAPGQSVVIYQGEEVVGGGIIDE